MKQSDRDRFYMKQALRLAARGRGRTSPNPMVGAVLVQSDRVVGQGYHQYVGGPHAEVNALRNAGENARGAVLYVTLEPCNHHGRTPPCTLAVGAAGVSRVVVGMTDPNPGVAGRGAETLRKQGVAVETGILEAECRLLNQAFLKHVTTGLPWVTLKAAATLDGRIATRIGDSRWISNERSRRFVHQLRCNLDGILVGIGTALADDPQLTSRIAKKRHCRQPVRIVLDTYLRLPAQSRLVDTAHDIPVWVACKSGAPRHKARELEQAGVKILELPVSNGHVDLQALLLELGKREMTSVLVEGGGKVLGAFVERGLADEFHFFYAPKILADPEAIPMFSGTGKERMTQALQVFDMKIRRFGSDVMLSGKFHERIY